MPTEFSGIEAPPSRKQIIADVSPSTFNWLLALSTKLKLKGPGDAAIYCANKCRAIEENRVMLPVREPPSIYLVREYLYANPEKTIREIVAAVNFSQPSVNNAIRNLDTRGEIVRGLRNTSAPGYRPQVISLSDDGRRVVEAKAEAVKKKAEAKARAARPISEIVADRERLIEAFKTNLTAYALQELEADEHPSEEATNHLLELGATMKGSYEALSELPTERMRIVVEVNAYIENVKAEHAEFPDEEVD